MTRRRGSSQAEIAYRQRLVRKSFFQGISPIEVAKHFNVDVRTIERDYEKIREELQQSTDREKIRSFALADAESGEMWREAWLLYIRLSTDGGDERQFKLAVLGMILRIKDQRDRLAFGLQPVHNNPQPADSIKEDAASDVINLLPPDLREKAIEAIRRRKAILDQSP